MYIVGQPDHCLCTYRSSRGLGGLCRHVDDVQGTSAAQGYCQAAQCSADGEWQLVWQEHYRAIVLIDVTVEIITDHMACSRQPTSDV